MESSVIFLRDDVLILNGKENKEATAICFEIRIPKKKNKELLCKVPLLKCVWLFILWSLVTVLKALFRIYQLIILANPVLWVKLGWIGFAYDRNFLELKKYTNFYYLYTYFQQWRHSRRHYPNGKSWYPMCSRFNCSFSWFQWLHYCKLQVHSSILIF